MQPTWLPVWLHVPSGGPSLAGTPKAPDPRLRRSGAFTICAPEGTRTPNLLIRSQMLYPLSYGRVAQGPGMTIPSRGPAPKPAAKRTRPRSVRTGAEKSGDGGI